MDFRQFLKDNFVILDGGMGSLLQKRGLAPGEKPEMFNLRHPEIVTDIQKSYFDAGSNVVNANTFGANPMSFPDEGQLREVIFAAIKICRDAARLSDESSEESRKRPKFVSFDMGSLGQLLKPYGQLDFEDAVKAFSVAVKIGAEAGADLVSIETMNDCLETKAALLAVKETCDLPVIVTDAFDATGRLMTGASPAAMTAMLEGMGADAIGTNCSLGPLQLRGVMKEFLSCASVPVVFKPNAGLPRVENGETVFDVTADEFAEEVIMQMKAGVRVVGGCCGTTPEYIRKVTELAKAQDLKPVPLTDKDLSAVSSYTHPVYFGKDPILIGERINPTGKKRFKQALIEHDMDYILGEGLRQAEEKVHILDVNVGIPDIDEPALLTETVKELQAVTDLPLQIDTSDPAAMEAALRAYNGKAMINSVNGKEEVMSAIFPLVKKYGGFVVALTIDERGIPETAHERIEVARRIIETAESYGIGRKDLIFDPLCMTISADTTAALTTLECVRILHDELGVHASLGISNVSFGLPKRNLVTSGMFAAALERGLSAAIMNPFAPEMMSAYYSFRALHDLDGNCTDFIGFADSYDEKYAVAVPAGAKPGSSPEKTKDADEADISPLAGAIIKGLKDMSSKITASMIKEEGRDPLEIVSEEVIPALNAVGESFEAKKTYLPQLLMSAEAAKEAFVIIKAELEKAKAAGGGGESKNSGCRIVIATVKGDVHDIGKNIVKLLLENYGFEVTDLGKDVDPQTVVDEVIRRKADICGLSALMTTTVPAMEETIKLVHEKAPWCRVMVGGAVLTQEYADKIGADAYSKDAMGSVRYAEKVSAEKSRGGK
ncbi:MAG: homocysteine S-methyltransferase family protein [Lachnospiraceae bacterium]|nr:homocysteine S-methyltransferase family protein [Lachnospiraceae bacterium]